MKFCKHEGFGTECKMCCPKGRHLVDFFLNVGIGDLCNYCEMYMNPSRIASGPHSRPPSSVLIYASSSVFSRLLQAYSDHSFSHLLSTSSVPPRFLENSTFLFIELCSSVPYFLDYGLLSSTGVVVC